MPGTQRIQPLLFFKAFTMPITAKTKARMRLSDSDKTKITLYPPNANAFISFMTNESRRKISEIMPLRFCLFFRMFIVCPPCVSPIVSHFAWSLQGGRGRFRSKQSKRFNFQRLSEKMESKNIH